MTIAVITLIAAGIGVMLGLRFFNVCVLIQAVVAWMIVIPAVGFAYGARASIIVVAAVLGLVALQIGYFAGAVFGYFVVKERKRKKFRAVRT
jgi:hypothetical protein